MNISKYLILILPVVVFVGGCNPAKEALHQRRISVPASFGNTTDTISDASVNWRDFFNDKYLSALIDTALANNYDLGIALQRIREASANVVLNKGAMKPYVKAIGATGINRYGDYTMDGAGNIGTRIYDGRFIPKDLPDYLLGLQTSWEIDLWGKLRNRKRASLHRFLATVEGKNLVITNIITQVANAYYDLLAYDKQLSIIDETISLQQNALEIVKVQKEAGMANLLAVEQFEAQLLALKSMRYETQRRILEQETTVNMLLGRFPQPVTRDTNFSMTLLPRHIKAGVPMKLLQLRPDIRDAEARLNASKADVKAARAAFYPSLNITGSAGVEAFLPKLLFNTPGSFIYGIAGGLTAPLLNRSLLKSDLIKADAASNEALLNYQKTITNGFTEVYLQMSLISNLRQSFDLKEEQVTTLVRSIETSSELFKTGRSSYLEILIAQQNALKARLELVDVRKSIFNTNVNIYKALGGGWQ